jgi:hypothetical protein
VATFIVLSSGERFPLRTSEEEAKRLVDDALCGNAKGADVRTLDMPGLPGSLYPEHVVRIYSEN